MCAKTLLDLAGARRSLSAPATTTGSIEHGYEIDEFKASHFDRQAPKLDSRAFGYSVTMPYHVGHCAGVIIAEEKGFKSAESDAGCALS